MDKTKLVKILRLMKLLTGNITQTVFQLAEELDTTPRSIYRYIDDIRDVGFVVNKLYLIRQNCSFWHFKSTNNTFEFGFFNHQQPFRG